MWKRRGRMARWPPSRARTSAPPITPPAPRRPALWTWRGANVGRGTGDDGRGKLMLRLRLYLAISILFVAALMLPGWTMAAQARPSGAEIASGTVLVQFHASAAAGLLSDRLAAVGAVMQETLP